MKAPLVKRLNISPYQNPEFSTMEKEYISTLKLPYLSWKEKVDPSATDSFLLISNTHTNWSLQNNQLLEKTKLILHPNSGYDNFSMDFLRQTQAPIILGNTIRSNAVTEYILTALFNHFYTIPKSHSWDEKREWNRTLFNEKSVLILGYGHIGKLLEKSLTPLFKNLFIYDPYEGKECDLKKVAPLADVIIPVAGLNKSSHHIINEELLALFPEDYLLINAARGKLIDNKALFISLKQNPKAYAILDVFENEPFEFRTVDHLDNIHLTSHIAGCFKEIDLAIIQFVKKTISDFVKLERKDFLNLYHDQLLQNKVFGDELI